MDQAVVQGARVPTRVRIPAGALCWDDHRNSDHPSFQSRHKIIPFVPERTPLGTLLPLHA